MKPTVFVLGAGASHDFSLPLGADLRTMIVRILNTNLSDEAVLEASEDHFATACRSTGIPAGEMIEAGEIIRAGISFSNSIDDFLSANSDRPNVLEIGRLAIAAAMLDAERRSSNHHAMSAQTVDARRNAVGVLGTWIGILFMRGRGVLKAHEADKALSNASFVVFNYDRCLEQFLLWAYRDAFSISEAEALKIVENIPIEHVYGSLGPLPAMAGAEPGVPYASSNTDLRAVAAGIRTYSEDAPNDAIHVRIEALMSKADRAVFLGYSFHEQGLKILYPSGPRPRQEVWGTTFKLSAEASKRAHGIVGDAGSQLANVDCVGFVSGYLSAIFAE